MDDLENLVQQRKKLDAEIKRRKAEVAWKKKNRPVAALALVEDLKSSLPDMEGLLDTKLDELYQAAVAKASHMRDAKEIKRQGSQDPRENEVADEFALSQQAPAYQGDDNRDQS